MKYYKLKFSWDRTNEIGCYPQSTELKFKSFNTNEVTSRDSINYELIPPEPILEKKAKTTSLLNVTCLSSLIFLVFHNNFIDFLNNFTLGDYQTWSIKIHYKNKVINEYCVFHISQYSDSSYVDFENSKFIVGKQPVYKDQKIGKAVNIKDYNDYLNLEEVITDEDKSLRIQAPKLILDFTKAKEDFIRFAEIPQVGYYVSEKLKNAILEKGFTGMDFIEIDEHS